MGTQIQGSRLIKFDNSSPEYIVPDSVAEIAELAFSGCDSLIALSIPDSVRRIGNYAFADCYSLRELKLPASVEAIGAGLFQKCWNIRELCLPEGLTVLGTDMFEGCHALYAVTIPDSVETIERTAFSTCRNLRKVYTDPANIHRLPPSARYLAALTYMEEHQPEEGSSVIDGYTEGRSKSLLDLAINRRSSDAVRYMLARGLIKPEALREYLTKSADTGRVEITALLLEYTRDDHAGSPDPDPFA